MELCSSGIKVTAVNDTVAKRNGLGSFSTWSLFSYKWPTALFLFVAFLALLFYAETVWLHESLPRDSVARVTLVAFPNRDPIAPGSGEPRALPAGWDRALLREASSPELVQDIIARLGLRDPETGRALTSDALLASMTFGSQCIELDAAHGGHSQGLLLYSVVRGSDSEVVQGVAAEWSRLVAEEGTGAVFPVSELVTSYGLCR